MFFSITISSISLRIFGFIHTYIDAYINVYVHTYIHTHTRTYTILFYDIEVLVEIQVRGGWGEAA